MGKHRNRRHPWLPSAVLLAGAAVCLFAYEITALSIFATAPPRDPAATSAVPKASLRLMAPFGPAFAGAIVAESAGLFERNGIRVKSEAGGDENDPIAAVVNGSDTFGITRADAFLLARAKGARIVAFASGFVEGSAVFYVLQKSEIQTPRDFAGHRVGRRSGDDTSIIYDALVAKLGLPQSRITEVPVATDLSALLTGAVDVWPGHVGDEDYTLEQKKLPYIVISPASFGVHAIGTVYFTTEQTIAEQPQLVRNFLAGLIAGWDMVYRDYAISVPMIRSFDQNRLSANYVRFVLDRQRPYLRPMAVRYGDFDDQQWLSLENTLLSQRLLKRTVDLPEAVTHDVLRDVYRKPLTFGE